MKENQKRFFQLIMVLQIFVISFAIMAIPAAAEVPYQPIAIKGSVELDGKLAPIGTEISVKLNEEEIAKVNVKIEGENSGLYVSIPSEDYPNLKFYIDGNEAKLLDATILENVDTEAVVLKGVNMAATSPVVNSNDNRNNNGGGGGSYPTSDSDEEIPSESTASTSTTNNADDTSLKSVAITQPTEPTEDVPAPETETGLSMMTILIGAIVLIGIVVIVGYKLKEN
jgi:hypothetical protein